MGRRILVRIIKKIFHFPQKCGHIDRRNRKLEVFRCLNCDHKDNADVNAARNILYRFLSGPYGAAYKSLMEDLGVPKFL